MKVKESNLKSFKDLTAEEQRKIARQGGIASGKARKEKKMIKEQLNLLLSLPLKDKKTKSKIEKMGIDGEDIDNQMALVIAMWQKAMTGDVSAFNTIRDTVGEKPQENINLSGNVNNPYENLTEEELRKLANE